MARTELNLPSPNALVAFEAAARHLSIKLAAEELKVTSAAISRHVANLEAQLGVALFERLHRRLKLTAAGESFFLAVTVGLGRIADAARHLRSESGNNPEVAIGSTIAFASLWLLPRIPSLTVAHPEITLRYVVSDRLMDVLDEELDIIARYGQGRWPGYRAEHLFDDDIFPICSPRYRARHAGFRAPVDLLNERLLHLEDSDRNWENWNDWFHHQGVEAPRRIPGVRFNNYIMMLQAVADGQGIALGWRYLVSDQIRRGSLVAALDASMPAGGAYYLLTRADRALSPAAGAVAQWLRETAASAVTRVADL